MKSISLLVYGLVLAEGLAARPKLTRARPGGSLPPPAREAPPPCSDRDVVVRVYDISTPPLCAPPCVVSRSAPNRPALGRPCAFLHVHPRVFLRRMSREACALTEPIACDLCPRRSDPLAHHREGGSLVPQADRQPGRAHLVLRRRGGAHSAGVLHETGIFVRWSACVRVVRYQARGLPHPKAAQD